MVANGVFRDFLGFLPADYRAQIFFGIFCGICVLLFWVMAYRARKYPRGRAVVYVAALGSVSVALAYLLVWNILAPR